MVNTAKPQTSPGLSQLFFRLLRKIMYLWVRTQVLGADKNTLSLDPDKPVCYVLQNTSLSSRLVLEEEVLKARLPSSMLAIGSKGEGRLRRAFFALYLRQGGWFTRRRTPPLTQRIRKLVHLGYLESDLDVQIVPVSLFWGRAPEKEKSLLKILLSDNWAITGRLKKFLIILIHGRNTFVQFNKPISLRQLLDEFPADEERATRKLARVLRVHFRRIRQAVIGPDLSHRRTLVHALILMPSVKEAIRETAKQDGLPPEKVRAKALAYGDEIAANMTMVTIRFLEVVLSWLWNKIYNGIRINNIETVQEVAKDHAVIYVPCHRSHIDYLLLSYVLYRNGLMPPHIAAGINLNMPVVGAILRRGGAFFMRRSFKDNPLYAAVFNEYMHSVFVGGHPVEYFVEGGRSRTGRTLRPKAGMLGMTVRSFLRDHRKPIALVPVYIGYEKVIEGRSYLGELRGGAKQQESIFNLFRSLKNLRKSFGQVGLNFGQPIQLASFLDAQRASWRDEAYDREFRPKWLNRAVDKLAIDVVTGINAAVAVNPINLLATLLLSTERLAMDERILARQMEAFCALLKSVRYADEVTFPEGSGQDWIHYAEQMGLAQRCKHPMGDIILIEGTNATLMTYYRNNIQHLFALPALIACLFQNNATLKRERIVSLSLSLYPYIRSELFLRWDDQQAQKVIECTIDEMMAQGLLAQDGDIISRPATGSEQAVRLRTLSRFIIQTLERYYISIAVLRAQGSGQLTPKELEERSSMMAQRMSVLFGLNAPEFFDKTLFREFISNLMKEAILSIDPAGKLVYSAGLEAVMEDARLVLNLELRQAILQVTSLNS